MDSSDRSAIANRVESIVDRIGSRLNPILVKEVRQAVRSRFVLGVFLTLLILFALIALFVSWFVAMNVLNSNAAMPTPPGSFPYGQMNFAGGKIFFLWIYGVLSFATLMFVPAYAGFRIGFERSGQDPDLLFITSLRPGEIIRGKALVAAMLALFFLSTGLPFMAFAYLLRGIDMPNVFFIMALTFVVSCTASCITILLGTIPTNKLGKVALLLIALYQLFTLAIAGIIMVVRFMDVGGFGSLLGSVYGPGIGNTSVFILLIVVFCGMLMWLCHSFTSALISPEPSNRILPIRIALTACWLIGLGIFVTLQLLMPSIGLAGFAVTISCVITIFGLLLASGERERPGPRVAAHIPRHPIGRLAVFPFFTGSAGGILWAVAIGISTLLVAFLYRKQLGALDHVGIIGTLLLYVYAYSISGLLIRRSLFRNLLRPGHTWVVTLLLMFIVSLLTFFITDIIFEAANIDANMPYGNLIKFATETDQIDHTLFAAVWAIAVTLIWFPIAYRQVEAFKRPEEAPAPEETPAEAEGTP